MLNYGGTFDLDHKKKQIEELTRRMSEPHFWQDAQASASVVSQIKNLKSITDSWQELYKKYQDLFELAGILAEQDTDLISEISKKLSGISQELSQLELKTLLGGEFDRSSAILSINAGAGGSEACDWAEMLFRMYSRWAETKGYKIRTTDAQFGEEAGIKSITAIIEGLYAYGYLRSERGVHRLVRISPFDANKRRHTSFASVEAIPEIADNLVVSLQDKELSIETYRASGPGGQHMQKADSAVRITHLPSGIIVQCQDGRSQYQNKQTALKILKARIYQHEKQKKEEEFARQFKGKKLKIEWGSQIRSYIMQPYTMVKDHRTDYETGNVNAVLNGEIDAFIEAYLRKKPEARAQKPE